MVSTSESSFVETDSLRQELAHVYWIGGSPCSGKSSIAENILKSGDFCLYDCDQAFFKHVEIITPEAQPTFYRVMHLSNNDLWMRPVEQQTREETLIYQEEFPLLLKDLLSLPKERPILAVGAALLPECVSPLLNRPQQGIWIVPAREFQLFHYSRREWAKDVVKDCEDPQQAFQNWMQRDICFASQVRQAAQERGLPILIVDGSTSIQENTARVQEQFWPGG